MSADVVFGEGSFPGCLLIVFSRQRDVAGGGGGTGGGSWEGEGRKRVHTLSSLFHIKTFKVPTNPNTHRECSTLMT